MKDNQDNNPTNNNNEQPGDRFSSPKTTPVAGPKGPAWWQTYEKAAPYNSSKRSHDNIRQKFKERY